MSAEESTLDKIWGIINSDQPDEAIMLSGNAQDEIQEALKAYADQEKKAYHQQRLSEVSEEEILEYAKKNVTYFNNEYLIFRNGAKWLLNKLKNKT